MSFVQRRLLLTAGLAALLATGVALLLRQDRVRNESAEAAAREGRLLACDAHGKVLEVALHTPEQNFVLVRQQNEPSAAAADGNDKPNVSEEDGLPIWQLRTPQVGLAETLVVQAIVDASCSLTRKGWALAPNSSEDTPLSAFNLEAAPYRLALSFADHETLWLEAGDKHPFDDSLAVRSSSTGKGVALVDGAFAFQLNKDLLALRDKRLVHLGTDDIVEVAVVSNEPGITPFVVRRQGEDFVMTSIAAGKALGQVGAAQPADKDAAASLLAAIATLRAKAFVNEAPEPRDLSAYGLMRPRLVVTIKAQSEALTTLKVGRVHVRGEDHHFAQLASNENAGKQGAVVELPSDYLIDKLVHGSEALRDLRLFHVAPGEVEKFVVHQGDKKLTFVRRATTLAEADARKDVQPPQRDGEVLWHLIEQPELAIEQADVDGLIYRVLHLRAESQPTRAATAGDLRRYALLQPQMVLEFFAAADRSLATLRVGDKEGNMRYVTDGHKEVVSRIYATTTDDIDISGQSFAARRNSETR